MKHFLEQVWANFVRGIGEHQIKSEIEAHIAKGCPDCMSSFSMWKKMYSIATNEPAFTPPDGAVRMARLEFLKLPSPDPVPSIMARLVFDSLSQPLTIGVRSGAPDSRQLMFDAEGTMVDVVLDVQPQSGTMSLMGQVLDKDRDKVTPHEVAVILWTDSGQPLAETAANEFGEFQMEFAAQDRVRLSVEIAGRKPIQIPRIGPNREVIDHPVT